MSRAEAVGVTPSRARPRELLAAGTPREVLARIVPGDPLELRARVSDVLAERALLCDAGRVLLRAQVLSALGAESWSAEDEPPRWLRARVEESIDEELGRVRDPGQELAAFALPLGLDPRSLAVACARFNRLSREVREAFFAVVLDGGPPEPIARARGLSLAELLRRVRSALEPFRGAARSGPAPR